MCSGPSASSPCFCCSLARSTDAPSKLPGIVSVVRWVVTDPHALHLFLRDVKAVKNAGVTDDEYECDYIEFSCE
jgi:hypothetical protein